jgi:hypothetical protein
MKQPSPPAPRVQEQRPLWTLLASFFPPALLLLPPADVKGARVTTQTTPPHRSPEEDQPVIEQKLDNRSMPHYCRVVVLSPPFSVICVAKPCSRMTYGSSHPWVANTQTKDRTEGSNVHLEQFGIFKSSNCPRSSAQHRSCSILLSCAKKTETMLS